LKMTDQVSAEPMAETEAVREPLTYPLSFSQRRLWFLDKLEPGKSVYNVSEALRLKGRLNRAALAQSVNEIIRRHDSLRTTFADLGGSPVQVVSPSLTIEMQTEDLTQFPAAGREREAARRIGDRASQPFDLKRGPLIRISLLQMASDEHILLIGMHHIVSEGGWSMGVFLRELNALYNAALAGDPAALPELPIQYGDYAVWQQDWLQGEVRDQLLDYWMQRLKGAPSVLDLPYDRPRPSEQSYAGRKESYLLPAALKSALNDLSRAEGATLFMTLFAGFATLLHRYARQEEVVIGIGSAGRGSPETHDLIGFFVNTLALRTDLSGDPSFHEMVQRTKRICGEAYEHEDLPFELLVDALKPERSLAYSPLFQVMFSYQNAPRGELQLTGIDTTPFPVEARSSMFDLTLFAWERPDGLLFSMEYSTRLFERATIQRLLAHFEILLAAAAAHPEVPVSRLPLLDPSERQRLLVDWNSTTVEFAADQCVHQVFEEQARKTPDAMAVMHNDASLTYSELNEKANRLAHYLRQLGVRPDARVALCLERGFEMIVAVLAVLKAGGAYVPLDPAYPPERLRFMLEDSAPVALLTRSESQALFGGLTEGLPILDLGSAQPLWEDQPNTDLDAAAVELTSRHLAYVIYTSGSTGTPKGVMVPHRAVNRLVLNNWYARLQAGDRVAFASNPAFDAGTMEMWGPLLNGGRVVVIDQDVLLDPARFGQALQRHKVSILWLTVGLFNLYAEALGQAFRKLRYLIVGGDALDPRVIARVLRDSPPEHLVNGYGPTETTTFAITHEIAAVARNARSIPIGKPIANTSASILDERQQLVPVGVVGELYIGGAGVARGYLNRPELTAERFLTDPFTAEPGACMYKTGDLAKWLPDGTIDFAGRNDFQVKLRGFRVELGEIEARLVEQPGVAEAVVLAREDTPGDKRLVAYYTSDSDETPLGAELLRANLTVQLPDYMVPAAYVRLASLPLTPHGKLDRRALPAPEAEAYDRRAYQAPVGEMEAALARIWTDLLKLERIGRQENYFELGGHSLLAVRLFSRIEKEFGVDLPLATLYRAPTVESLALIVAQGGRPELDESLVPINPTGRKPPLYCASGLGGGVLVFRDLAVLLGPDQPFYGLQPKREGGKNVPLMSVPEIASGYLDAIREIQPNGPYYLSGYSFGGLIAFEMAQQLTDAGLEVAFLALFDTTAPLRVKSSEGSGVRRTYGTAWQRVKEILSSSRRIDSVRHIVKWRTLRLRERVAQKLKLQPLAELETLVGSQSFAGMDYVGRPYSGPITLFRSQLRPSNELWSYTLGWENLAPEVRVREVPGDHTSIYSGENITTLAANLTSCLESAQREAAQYFEHILESS
jgi:amino acid adenylation domain-containing protein